MLLLNWHRRNWLLDRWEADSAPGGFGKGEVGGNFMGGIPQPPLNAITTGHSFIKGPGS